MNLNLAYLKKILEPTEIDKLKKAIARDKIILPVLIKIVDYHLSMLDMPINEKDFDKPSWPYYQACKEGKKAELLKLKNLLKEKETNE